MRLEELLQGIIGELYAAPILYMPVEQTGHFALRAGLPFFMVTFSGLSTSLFARHFTQYIDAIV